MHDSSRLPGPISTLWGGSTGVLPRHGLLGFFHPEGERGGSRRRRDERAKAICQDCPSWTSAGTTPGTRDLRRLGGMVGKEAAYYERRARRFTDEPA